MHGQMHCAYWDDLMYKVTHDLNIAGSDILVGTSYDVLNHFVNSIEWKPDYTEWQLESSQLMECLSQRCSCNFVM